MTQQNNIGQGFSPEALNLIRELTTERAQADEMEIKEMDPNGNAVIATEQGVTITNAEPEDSLYFGEERKRVADMSMIDDTIEKPEKNTQEFNSVFFQKPGTEKEPSKVLDALFDGFKGIIQTFSGMNSGEVMRSQQTIDELNFMEKALDIEDQFKSIDKQLDDAYLAQDIETVRKLYPIRKSLFEAYETILPDLNKGKRKYWDEVMKHSDKKAAIEQWRNELLEDNVINAADMERWNSIQNYIDQNIYAVSEEWEKGKEGEYGVFYQLPNALGTSASSLGVSIATGLAAAATNFIAESPALSTGPAGAAIVGGSALLTFGASTVGTLWARNQESLSEVSNNYMSAIQEYAQKHNIDTSEIIAEGRRKLQELTGSYSDDPNDPEYRDDSQVLTGMLTYGIDFTDLELEKARIKSRRQLEDVYNRNMMLGVSDVTQNFVMIPGMGKMFNTALNKFNIADQITNATVNTIDDIMKYTAAKVGKASAESVAKRTSKYIVEPTMRVGFTGLSEGFEELSQYMFGKQLDPDNDNITNRGDISLFNPIDLAITGAENFGMLVKGIEGLMGISKDEALNNDEEMVKNFQVGTLVGMLMGGGHTFNEARKDFNAYNKGMNIARQMVASHVDARETMFRYNQYAEKALGGHVRWEAMRDGFDMAMKDTEMPEGWSREDFEKEKSAAQNIFALVNSPYVQELPEEHRAAAAAYLQYTMDKVNNARNDFYKGGDPQLESKIQKAIESYCFLHGIDDINSPLLRAYFETKQRLEAINKYDESLQFLKGYTTGDETKIVNIGEEKRVLQENLDLLTQQLKSTGLYDKATNYNGLTTVAEDINRDEINALLKKTALDNIEDEANSVLNNSSKLLTAVKKYKQSIEDNKEIKENLRRVEDENLDAAIDTQNNAEEQVVEQEEGTGLSVEPVPVEHEVASIEVPVVEPSETVEETTEQPVEVPSAPVSLANATPAQLLEESFLAQHQQFEDIEDYDSTDYVDELSEESFDNSADRVVENFEEETITRISALEEENAGLRQQLQQQDQRIAELERLIREGARPEQQPHEIVEHPEQLSHEPTADEIEEAKIYEEEQPAETPVKSDPELFYSENDTPMFPGYESGKRFAEYSATPGNIQQSKLNAWVGEPNSRYGQYDQNDRSTWDNAAVYVEVEGVDGKKYITALKTIEGAKLNAMQRGVEFTKQMEDELRNTRNTIIAAKLADPDTEITFEEVRMSAGQLNNQRDAENRAVQRNLTEIKGLHLPTDLHELFDQQHGLRFGIGKGVVDHFAIVDRFGNPLPGHGGSGKIFIYPAESSTLDGVSRPIQLTEKRFAYTPGDTNSFAHRIAKALIFGETSIEGIPVEDILKVMLNYGEKTILSANDVRNAFMGNKQFNFNYSNGTAVLGNDTVNLSDIRNNDGIERVAKFIADNLHWNTEKLILWDKLPSSFGAYLRREGIKKASLFNGELQFDEEDLTLSGMAYLIKHGYLTSDLGDQIYKSPFIYVSKPVVRSKPAVDPEPTGVDNTDVNEQIINETPKVEEGYDPYTDPSSDETSAFFGNINGAPKISTVRPTTRRINEKQARKWLSNKLGIAEEDVEIVDGVIRTLSNGRAVMGVAKEDGILLSNVAEYGVEYHEAWHRVSLLMLTPEQKQRLYKEFRKTNAAYRHANDRVVEEVIADQFMDYMIADDKEGIKYYVNKYFRKFKHFIGINASVDHYSLQEMFKALKYGELAKYKLDKAALEEFRKAYKQGANYTIGPNKNVKLASINSPYEYQQLLNSLKSIIVVSNGLKYVSQIQNLDNDRVKQFLTNRMMSPRLTTGQKQVLGEVINNFDTIMKDLQPIMEKMGIRQMDETQDNDFSERESTGIQNYDKAVYEFSKKDNALGSAKIFLSTIPDTFFVYTNGVKSQPVPRISELTGLPMIVDYDTAYAKVLKYLCDCDTFAPTKVGEDANLSILGKCKLLGETDPFFAMLYTRLCNVDLNTETQLLQTIKSFNQNFQEISYETDNAGNSSFILSDSINKRAIRNKPVQWSENFFNSKFVKHEENKTTLDKDALANIQKRFNELLKLVTDNATKMDDQKLDTYLTTLIEMFNELGIVVDREVFDMMLGSYDRVGAFVHLMNNRNAGSTYHFFNSQLDAIIKNREVRTAQGMVKPRELNRVFVPMGPSILTTLATYDAQAHPSESEIAVLGPNNNVIFTKTLNCFVSDQVRWLNQNDEQVMTDLNSDPYCRSSLILNQVNSGGKIKLNTFVNFYGMNRNDKGRDYVSISPVEDYIAKMVFTWNNHIIFPTMADKKTWFTISGCQLFNRPFEFPATGKLKVDYDINALDHVYNEWLDEYNTIVEYYNTLSNVIHPIVNYHTAGKGGLFRHHTGYHTVINGELKWVDLNKRLQEAVKGGTVKQTLQEIKEELFTDKKATYQKINDNLAVQRRAEIDECVRMGIVEFKNGKLVNKLLDATVLKHFTDIYKQHANPDVANNAEHWAIATMIGNHALNYNISVEETEKIFTGDSAFYKNNEDKIKRLGAVLSTGDNLRTQWMAPSVSIFARTEEKREAISKQWLKRSALQNRQTYTSTVINDNLIPSQQYEQLKELFTQYYIRQLLVERGLSEAQVDALKDSEIKSQYPDVIAMAKSLGEDDASAYGMFKGKGAINQADAAVYISPQMYKDIVQMLGEWSDEIEEAFEIMESGIDWLNDRVKCAKAMKALIKPLKTTYFCNQYNADIKHTVPVFDKMAMFPLFRVLATGDNKEIYDRMNAIGKYEGQQKIDQVAFESAKKVGIIGATDVYHDYHNNEINDLSKMHVVTQRFRNLRRQLITDPHEHDRTLFGTQVSTVAVSNLILDRVYQEGTENQKTGREIMQHLFGTINAISNHGIEEVKNIYLTNGELDLEKTSMVLVRKAHSQNMGKDVEDALQLNETKDDFKVPLAALPDSKWVETAIVSDVNRKAVDLELPGGAFIQMSSFGVKSIRTIKASSSEYVINNGKRLVNMNPDGSMDAVISINLLKYIIPGYENMSFMEARQWLIDNNIIGTSDDVRPAALGYRIPTQGLSSIAGMRITDVLPPVVGDTIILPDEFTAQTGSDFDIDKLYIARYNYENAWVSADSEFESWYRSQSILMAADERGKQQYTNRFESKEAARIAFIEEKNKAAGKKQYRIIGDVEKGTDVIEKKGVRIVPFDHSKGYEGNSREANENLLLRTYLDVLTDKKNVGETRLPLDKTTGIIKDEILPIVDGPAKKQELIPYKELSPSYQMSKKYEYNGGKAGIGPFALNNKNHILTQLMGLRFKEDVLLTKLGFLGLDGINSRDEVVFERDSKGNKVKDENGDYVTKLDKGIRILDWLSAMINAHVDVAKDPYVIRLNVCQYTYNLCNFLLRAGYGKSTFFFLPQPILKEMSAAYDNAAGNYGVDATKSKTKVINEAIQQIRQEYADKFTKAAAALNKTDIVVNVDKYGLTVNKTVVHKDNNGKDVSSTYELTAIKKAEELTNRDFLIDQLRLSQKEQLTDKEAYDYYLNQLFISELFLELNEKAEDMSKLVQLSQIDTKKYGNNFVEQDRFVYRWKAFLENTNLFEKEDLLNYYHNTFLYTKMVNGIATSQAIFENTMLRSKRSFLDSITKALMLTVGLEHNDEVLNKIISNEFEAQIRNRFLSGKIDLHSMFYGTNTMAMRLNKIKSDILRGVYPEYRTQDGKIANGLLNHLDVLSKLSTDMYDAPQIITRRGISENDKNINSVLKEYWSELLNSSHPEIKQFAEDLVWYMLATTGGNHTKNGIFNLVPIEYIISSGYGEFMRSSVESFGSHDIDFDMFFLNNWHNDKLVKPVKLTERRYMMETNSIENADAFPIIRFKDTDGRMIPGILNPNIMSSYQNKDRISIFPPFIKTRLQTGNNPADVLVYKFVGVDMRNNTPIYVLTNKLGLNQNGRVIKEYHSYNNSSEFEFNNHKFANLDIFGDINVLPLDDYNKKILQMYIENSVPVKDYMPVTKALSTELKPNLQRKSTTAIVSTAPVEAQTEEIETLEAEEVKPNNTFTFSNGFTVNTGFVLNDQQRNALKTLEQFVNDPSRFGHTITLSGYAGTGKTTIMKFLHAYLEAQGNPPVYAAPTNKAAAVTVENNPNARSMTINKLLNLPVFYDPTQDKLDLSKLKTITENMHLPEGVDSSTVVIIDESSMIDDSLLEAINLVKPFVKGIIFMGDSAQLSPVQHEDGRKSKIFEGKNTLELTKVERTGDNPVLKECTNLRNGLPLTYQTHMINGQGVIYTHNTDITGIKMLLSQIINSSDESNANAFRICCGTNSAVQQMNSMVREIMFGDAKAPIRVGEIITAYDNVGYFMNSVDYVVADVGQERSRTFQTRFGYVTAKVQNIVLREVNAKTGHQVSILSLDNDPSVYNEIAAINKRFHTELNNPAIKRDPYRFKILAKEFAEFRSSFAPMKSITEDRRTVVKKQFDFGYALTVHKSQGSTYDQVMFHEPSVENAKFLESTKQQLKYVAVSRARSRVYVLTDSEVQPEVKQLDAPKLTKTKTTVTRAQAMRNPKTLYIFTDNTNRTSGKTEIDPESWYSQKYRKTVPLRYPSQTSAMLRGLDNARPISTQHWYDKASGKTRDAGRWNDSDFAEFKKVIDEEIQDIKEAWDSGKYDNVVIATPAGILRTAQNAGISGMLEDRVPKLFKYLLYKMKELDAHINGRQFNETYEEKQQSNDLVITGSASTTAAKAKEVGGIDTLRHPDANGMHFGNPFSHTNYQGVQKVVPTVKDAVIAFEQWLRGEAHQEVESERRQWIVNQINNGSLKGKPIVYYTNTVPDNSYGVTEYNAQTAPNHAHILQKLINEGNIQNQQVANPSEFINHSGGAYGGDTMWDLIGRKHGVQDHRHYRDENNTKLSKTLDRTGVEATILSKEQMDAARVEIEKLLGKKYPNTVEGNLQVRNYYQVANADAVYAVAILSDNKKGVTGGTNTAVQLGIKLNKPVFVWDLTTEQWYKYDGKQFSPSDTPTLTKNFAGVGTRDIEDYNVRDEQTGLWIPRKQFVGLEKAQKARNAIDNVYKKTFGEGAKKRAVQLDLFQHDTAAINVYSADKNGYEALSNFEVRPFSVKNAITGQNMEFKSVEQAFQFTKAMYYAKDQNAAYEILRPTISAWEIKQRGRTVSMNVEQIEKWNKVSTGLMYRLMKTSFMQNESAKELLLATGDAILTHKNERGQEQDGGRFSKLLMQIRDEIRQMEQEGNEDLNNCKTR